MNELKLGIKGGEAHQMLSPYVRTSPAMADNQTHRRLELNRVDREVSLFCQIAQTIGLWATECNIAVVAPSNRRAERFVMGAFRYFPKLSVVTYRRNADKVLRPHEFFNGAQAKLESGEGMFGIFSDQMKTGIALWDFAQTAPLLDGVSNKCALVIADLSQKVEGVGTAEEAAQYLDQNPTEPPPRMDLAFSWEAIFKYSLAPYVSSPPESA